MKLKLKLILGSIAVIIICIYLFLYGRSYERSTMLDQNKKEIEIKVKEITDKYEKDKQESDKLIAIQESQIFQYKLDYSSISKRLKDLRLKVSEVPKNVTETKLLFNKLGYPPK